MKGHKVALKRLTTMDSWWDRNPDAGAAMRRNLLCPKDYSYTRSTLKHSTRYLWVDPSPLSFFAPKQHSLMPVGEILCTWTRIFHFFVTLSTTISFGTKTTGLGLGKDYLIPSCSVIHLYRETTTSNTVYSRLKHRQHKNKKRLYHLQYGWYYLKLACLSIWHDLYKHNACWKWKQENILGGCVPYWLWGDHTSPVFALWKMSGKFWLEQLFSTLGINKVILLNEIIKNVMLLLNTRLQQLGKSDQWRNWRHRVY